MVRPTHWGRQAASTHMAHSSDVKDLSCARLMRALKAAYRQARREGFEPCADRFWRPTDTTSAPPQVFSIVDKHGKGEPSGPGTSW